MLWVSYVVACWLLHHLLSFHHQDVCRPSWWSLGLDPSSYCAFLSKALHAIRAAPLLIAVPHLPRVQ